MSQNSVFKGKNSLLDYLNPNNQPLTPMVELNETLNPFSNQGVRIFAKLMNTTPLANVKYLPAFNMLNQAKEKGKLNNIDTIIENSSGNTVLSLAIIANLMGIKNTKAVVSNEVTEGKLQMLRLFGTEIIVNKEPICPDPSDKESGIYKSKIWAKENNWLNIGQYDNDDNPEAHKKWTGKQIWEQMEENISVFCCGLGTTGTMVGAGSYLKEKNQNIKNIGVVRTPNNPVPGPRTLNLLHEIAFDWKTITDEVFEVGTIDSFRTSMMLCRNGLLVGPSSGFNLCGLLQYIKKQLEDNNLEELKNESGEINCVFICCDSPMPYLNEYFEYLDDAHFPSILNQELLKRTNKSNTTSDNQITDFEYNISAEEVLDIISINNNSNAITIDIRNQDAYDQFHIQNSINIPFESIAIELPRIKTKFQGKKIILVCNRGNKSKIATNILRNSNLDAYSMLGGMTEWSNKNLPRWQPEVCLIFKEKI
jgi:cysteine synthase/rhodanese-related sulfurtransferase